ncbi:MAG: hypothetical protein HOI43_17915 [Gammaproteobacteria bacterium]|nr:hypothetical protein [Gammaproteobacteria bacterium]MBT6247298.1 hypothetical protein [Gammaproteobacteria bacterium]
MSLTLNEPNNTRQMRRNKAFSMCCRDSVAFITRFPHQQAGQSHYTRQQLAMKISAL